LVAGRTSAFFGKDADDEGSTRIVHTAGQCGLVCDAECDVDADVFSGGVRWALP
jgi:hypothetical protein